ncbi:MAG TPA: hypothetical protein DCQ26_08070 [Marinilabiliales bacterium]|nr:MAG: hypothetical protein A2W96_10645 [Bacteroidetes bacterium GWD2_40_43]OFX95629.1 MAG: hypothetical protein A2W97_00965 [Bacteroidetes bacterium GWE2_40_63]OFY22175.1 MAG: hypothetical protein A2W88_05550 [Bacteroidetes bacterium GWF2_40_13]OFZ23549.1 MAG: hypothetical protein A2437_11095 [Bacteroidetes bacterium RIFOXYC2_FULL_40_12]HAM98556.1 hypothetical protein [Marinilabiliales bacterium]
MKLLIISIWVTLLISNCSNFNKNNVIIKASQDTVISGEMYIAELYVSYNENILPAFYILKDNDTLGLEFDIDKKCGLFRSIRKTEGEKIFNGFVDYTDLNGNRQISNFIIKYYVKIDSIN